MKKLSKYIGFYVIPWFICFSLLAMSGCTKEETTTDIEAFYKDSGGSATVEQINNKNIDTSEKVELIGYLIGERPAGMNDVLHELNQKLLKDINATMKINYIRWGDLQAKYALVLASGEDLDWIFTGNWAYYGQEAAKGAFLEITQDMVGKYMPGHYAATDPLAWKEGLIGGKLFMVPSSTPDVKVNEVAIREDLREKYNVPEINKWLNIEPYLKAIKKNEPNMIPINVDSAIDITRPFFYQLAATSKSYFDLFFATSGGSGIVSDTDDPEGRLVKITDPSVINDYKNAAATIKDWYERGYINKNAFSNKIRSMDLFLAGKSSVAFGNTVDMQNIFDKAKEQGWKVKIIPGLSKKGTYPQDSHINNGFAIVSKSKHPERTLMAMDLIMEEPAYNQLVYYGVEGKNFVVKDSKIALPDGVTSETNTYPPDLSGFWFTNKNQLKYPENWSEDYIKVREAAKKQVAPYVYSAFVPDVSMIKTEVANLNQVVVQYFNPINLGMIKDVDQAFAMFDEKLTAAGFDRVMEEMKRQTDEYKKEKVN
ncbi:MAG: hypothetical protein K0R50_130 [Eubacterium sp.]|jgi:putative aldouronate transport system substrate-binding protein|nr:hypothetical protein [Eubacterium sp.]